MINTTEYRLASKYNAIPVSLREFTEEELSKVIKVLPNNQPPCEISGKFYRSFDTFTTGLLKLQDNVIIDLSGYSKNRKIRICLSEKEAVIVKTPDKFIKAGAENDPNNLNVSYNLGIHNTDNDMKIVRKNLSLIDKIVYTKCRNLSIKNNFFTEKELPEYSKYFKLNGLCKNKNSVKKQTIEQRKADGSYVEDDEATNYLTAGIKQVTSKTSGKTFATEITIKMKTLRKLETVDLFKFVKTGFKSSTIISFDKLTFGYLEVDDFNKVDSFTFRKCVEKLIILTKPDRKVKDLLLNVTDIYGDIEDIEDFDLDEFSSSLNIEGDEASMLDQSHSRFMNPNFQQQGLGYPTQPNFQNFQQQELSYPPQPNYQKYPYPAQNVKQPYPAKQLNKSSNKKPRVKKVQEQSSQIMKGYPEDDIDDGEFEQPEEYDSDEYNSNDE